MLALVTVFFLPFNDVLTELARSHTQCTVQLARGVRETRMGAGEGLTPHCLLPTRRAELPVAFRGGATSLSLCHKQHV